MKKTYKAITKIRKFSFIPLITLLTNISLLQAQTVLYSQGGVTLTVSPALSIGTANCGTDHIGTIYKLYYELNNSNSYPIHIIWSIFDSQGAPMGDGCFALDYLAPRADAVKDIIDANETFGANAYAIQENGTPQPFWQINSWEQVKQQPDAANKPSSNTTYTKKSYGNDVVEPNNNNSNQTSGTFDGGTWEKLPNGMYRVVTGGDEAEIISAADFAKRFSGNTPATPNSGTDAEGIKVLQDLYDQLDATIKQLKSTDPSADTKELDTQLQELKKQIDELKKEN